LEVTTRTNY